MRSLSARHFSDTFHDDVLSSTGMDLFHLHQSHKGAGGGGDFLIVEGNPESIQFLAPLFEGLFEFTHELAVPWFEDVQAGPLTGQQEDAQGKQRKGKRAVGHSLQYTG